MDMTIIRVQAELEAGRHFADTGRPELGLEHVRVAQRILAATR